MEINTHWMRTTHDFSSILIRRQIKYKFEWYKLGAEGVLLVDAYNTSKLVTAVNP